MADWWTVLECIDCSSVAVLAVLQSESSVSIAHWGYRGSLQNSHHHDHKFRLMKTIWFNNEIFLPSSAICRLREAVAVAKAVAEAVASELRDGQSWKDKKCSLLVLVVVVAVPGTTASSSSSATAAVWVRLLKQAVGAWHGTCDQGWRKRRPIDGANHLHWRHRPAQTGAAKGSPSLYFPPSLFLSSRCKLLITASQ